MESVKRETILPKSVPWETQTLLCTGALGIIGFVVLYPLGLLLLNSFQISRADEGIAYGLDHWRMVFMEPGMQVALLNTIKVTLILQVVSLPIAIFIVWLLARTDLPGKNWIEFLFWIAFFTPSLPITLGWILLLDPDFGLFNRAWSTLLALEGGPFDIYSFWGIVWVHLATRSIVVKVILLTPFLRNMDSSLEEASRVTGAGPLRTLANIVVPLLTPAILVVMLMSVIHLLESFEIEQVLGPPFRFYVYSTMLYRMLRFEPPEYGGATVLAVVILLAIAPLIGLQQLLSKRRPYTTVTGRFKAQSLSLGAWKWPAFTAVMGLGVIFTFLPLLFLGLATFMRLFGFFDLPDPWTLEHWARVFRDPIFRRSLSNTILLGSATTLLAILCYPPIAYIVVRTQYKLRQFLDFLSWLPIAIPGIVLGLGFLWFFLGTPIFRPLYGSILVLILATTISSMTLGVQLLKSNLLQLGEDLEEASWVAGGAWFYTLRRVILPILAPVLLTVGLVSFISAARNVAGIALLVTSENRPLSMLQLDYMVEGRYEAAAVVGVIVTALSTGVALLARLSGLHLGVSRS